MTLLIFGVFMLAAFYSGFYFGHLKREGTPPDFPIIPVITEVLDKIKDKKPDKEEEKANSFFS